MIGNDMLLKIAQTHTSVVKTGDQNWVSAMMVEEASSFWRPCVPHLKNQVYILEMSHVNSERLSILWQHKYGSVGLDF